jgi:hypothetical protein
MKNTTFGVTFAVFVILVAAFSFTGHSPAQLSLPVYASNSAIGLPGTVFIHKATLTSIVGNATMINNGLINGNPDSIVIVTQVWNPAGASTGVYNPRDVGVRYFVSSGRWGIFNEDSAPMPLGAAFNVFVADGNAAATVHSSTSGNTSLYSTSINHTLTNNNANALVFTTHLHASPGHPGENHDHALGVLYNYLNRWAIFNQDTATMNLDVDFNILVAPEHPNIYVHTATPENTSGPVTFLSHPLLTNNPYARVMLTSNWNPGGSGGTFNDHPIAVWYDIPGGRWCVFSEDFANMPVGSSYNIMIDASATYLPVIHR